MPRKLREYGGTGKIISNAGTQAACDFVLSVSPTGKLLLKCACHDVSSFFQFFKENEQNPPLECYFEGLLADSRAFVTAKKNYLNRIHFGASKDKPSRMELEFYPFTPVQVEYQQVASNQEVEYCFGLVNLLFLGTEWVQQGNQSLRNRISLNIDGYDISLQMLGPYNVLCERLSENRGIMVTANLIVKAPLAQENKVREICENLCIILSFATGTWVTWICEDCYLEGRLVKSRLLPAKTLAYHHHADTVIDTRSGEELREYLETVYPNYVKARNTLGLDVVIEYYVHSKLMNVIELSYLLGAVGMECLKSYLSGYFQAKNKSADLGSFAKALQALFEDILMPYQRSELDFVSIRDKIVHTGRFPPNVNPVEEYRKLINLYDRVILTILGYRGKPYLNATKGYAKELLP